MRVAVVSPRYGPDIVGGSEAAMRMIAERLVAQLGWRVEALTTCATDHTTWANDLPAGESTLDGVRVRRFPTVHGRRSVAGLERSPPERNHLSTAGSPSGMIGNHDAAAMAILVVRFGGPRW